MTPKYIQSEIEELCHNGQRIRAIQRYRETVGSSLKEAKNAVDSYIKGGYWPRSVRWDSSVPAPKPDPMEVVAQLCTNGQIIKAIKAYRDMTGASLKEAKQAVEEYVRSVSDHRSDTPTTSKLIDRKHIESLLNRGQKIQAIKYYRKTTGAGLKDAKHAIEGLTKPQSWSNNPLDSSVSMANIRKLCADDMRIKAIKAYREYSGVSLKEAKQAIDTYIAHGRGPLMKTLDTPTLHQHLASNTPAAPFIPSKKHKPALDALPSSTIVLNAVDAKQSIVEGILVHTQTALYFLNSNAQGWHIDQKWDLDDLQSIELKTSFMDTELLVCHKDGLSRFSVDASLAEQFTFIVPTSPERSSHFQPQDITRYTALAKSPKATRPLLLFIVFLVIFAALGALIMIR